MATRKRPPVQQLTAQEQKEDLENLLVFGYQCKLFRDDEKAEYIEHGKHLIPWMGDNTVMIDRSVAYDAFGDFLNLPEKVPIYIFDLPYMSLLLRSVISSTYRQFRDLHCSLQRDGATMIESMREGGKTSTKKTYKVPEACSTCHMSLGWKNVVCERQLPFHNATFQRTGQH